MLNFFFDVKHSCTHLYSHCIHLYPLVLTLYLGLNWSYRNWEMIEVLPTLALPSTSTRYLVLFTRQRLTNRRPVLMSRDLC